MAPAVTWILNFVHLTESRRVLRNRKTSKAIDINFSIFVCNSKKLMAMSSYLINSNYVDPKFPPCEEYSQNDYLPSHSPDYYSAQRREPAFQNESIYNQRSGCTDPPYTTCQGPGQPTVVISPRGHVLPPAGLSTPVPEPSHHCDSVTPSPPPACGQNPLNQSPSTASSRKDPVVYPWMKKVHVNIGKCC